MVGLGCDSDSKLGVDGMERERTAAAVCVDRWDRRGSVVEQRLERRRLAVWREQLVQEIEQVSDLTKRWQLATGN